MSLLYTSPFIPYAAIQEMEIQEREKFGLIVYKAVRPVKVVKIGLWEDISVLSD